MLQKSITNQLEGPMRVVGYVARHSELLEQTLESYPVDHAVFYYQHFALKVMLDLERIFVVSEHGAF